MTPDELEKEAERVNADMFINARSLGKAPINVLSDALRAVHDAAIEKAASVVEHCTKQHGGAGQIHLDLASEIRAFKMGGGR